MADGSVMMEVKETYPEEGKLLCSCLNNAEIGSRKNCNLPGVIVNLPVLTAKVRTQPCPVVKGMRGVALANHGMAMLLGNRMNRTLQILESRMVQTQQQLHLYVRHPTCRRSEVALESRENTSKLSPRLKTKRELRISMKFLSIATVSWYVSA